MRLLFALFAIALGCIAQPTRYEYVVHYTYSLSSAAAVTTLQQPSTGGKRVEFKTAYVECSVACTVTVERDGTAATATALTPTKVNAFAPTAAFNAFRNSDVGSGTALSPAYSVPAGGSIAIDLSGVFMEGSGTGINVSLRTNSVTGTVKQIVKVEVIY